MVQAVDYIASQVGAIGSWIPPWYMLVGGTAIVVAIGAVGFFLTCQYRVLIVREVADGVKRSMLDYGRVKRKKGATGLWLIFARKPFEKMPPGDAHLPFGRKYLVMADMDNRGNIHYKRHAKVTRTIVRTIMPAQEGSAQ